ncbi:bifunctional histidine phosphatase family protein/GNAT family N-acetyltransferase [Agathobaculum sp.]|uniref:bifunctional histidine phosphatase family protein/GNAT family N-acetyltransferase n=1 Tax=Agathobaculum sp. TaxID=2048138 RepID=UPI002A7F7D1F|nr:bifunctional histidine phosphatase family protein/GNAT family N-acetyltransferase [Agathobaculum sp.]MDY3619252.1 bifunctional histidine phosphatase family protein/GNAT family N-acetyltransferase [Agathobaculum sp.]
MKTTVYLVRHAEAEGNVYRRCHGQYDSLLTPRAYQQLPYLAKRFEPVHLDAVFASDLFRARTTAGAIAGQKGLAVEIRPVLREIDMGDWEDLTWAELPLFWPEKFAQWRARPWDAVPPHGESVMQAGQRMLDGVRELVREREGQTFAVVTHGSAIRGALCIAHGWPAEQMAEIGWGDNTCVAKFEFDGPDQIDVVYENDASHLPAELSTFASIGWTNAKGQPNTPQIWFRRADPLDSKDAEAIVHYMREIHRNAYGTESGVHPDDILQNALDMLKISPRAVTLGTFGETGETAALVCMDTRYEDEPNVGLVGGFCIEEKYRGCGLSQQILGQAISVYRALGKEYLCAHVAEHNERAKGFYHKYAFEQRGEYRNENGNHYRMFKRIKVDSCAV